MKRLINLGVADIIHAIEIGHAHRQKGAAQQPIREFGRALKAKMAYLLNTGKLSGSWPGTRFSVADSGTSNRIKQM